MSHLHHQTGHGKHPAHSVSQSHRWWWVNSYQGGSDLVSFSLFIFPLDGRRAVGARHLARHHGAQHGAAGRERGARHGHGDGGQLQGQALPVTHRQCRHLLSGRQLDDQHLGAVGSDSLYAEPDFGSRLLCCPENVGSCYSVLNFTFRCSEALQDCWHLTSHRATTFSSTARGKLGQAVTQLGIFRNISVLRLCVVVTAFIAISIRYRDVGAPGPVTHLAGPACFQLREKLWSWDSAGREEGGGGGEGRQK